MVQDADGDLIFGTEGKAYFCKKDSILTYGEPIEIKFPEKINEPLNVRIINKEVCFIQSAGILVFDKSTLSVNYQNKEEYALRNFRFISSNDNIWKYKDNSWTSIDPNKEVANKIYWRHGFPCIYRRKNAFKRGSKIFN